MSLEGRKIIVGVTGSIAAYKACDVVSRLRSAGAEVRVVMTESAQRLIGPTTFRSISGAPVSVEMFADEQGGGLEHIALADWADALLIVPATANILGKAANGIADDLMSTVTMACDVPKLAAPAMNSRMWENPSVQANVATLIEMGWRFVGPGEGRLASGAVGIGRLAKPEDIASAVAAVFAAGDAGRGLKALVTAGPTREAIDPVRFISNPSSGRMGYALAAAARDTGAEVTLVSGPTELGPPVGVTTVGVVSLEEMRARVLELAEEADVVISAAAPADYTVLSAADEKLHRSDGPLTLELQPTPDILAEVGSNKGGKTLVGFAAETGGGRESAARKLQEKNLDLIVLNDVTEPGAGFAVETNRVTLLWRQGREESLPLMAKADVARRIWREVLILNGRLTESDPS